MLSETASRVHGQQTLNLARTLLEAMPQLVWTCTPDGLCDYLNRQWLDFTGFPFSEQIGRGWINALHPDDRQRVSNAWNNSVADRAPYDIEYRIRRFDGVYRWFKTRGV